MVHLQGDSRRLPPQVAVLCLVLPELHKQCEPSDVRKLHLV